MLNQATSPNTQQNKDTIQQIVNFLSAETQAIGLSFDCTHDTVTNNCQITVIIPRQSDIGQKIETELTTDLSQGIMNDIELRTEQNCIILCFNLNPLTFNTDSNIGISFLHKLMHNLTPTRAVKTDYVTKANLAFCSLLNPAFAYFGYQLNTDTNQDGTTQINLVNQITHKIHQSLSSDLFRSNLIPLLGGIANENSKPCPNETYYKALSSCFILFGKKLCFAHDDHILSITDAIDLQPTTINIDDDCAYTEILNYLNPLLYDVKRNLTVH